MGIFVGVNIGNAIDAIKFIKKHDNDTFEEIKEAIVKQIRLDNEFSIDMYEIKRYDQLKRSYKDRKFHSQEKYIEYVEKCDGKPMLYKDFVKKEFSEDYIDFSFEKTCEEYLEKIQQKYGDSEYEHYKNIIKDLKDETNIDDWYEYVSDGYIECGEKTYMYIYELLESIAMRFGFECYDHTNTNYDPFEYIIGGHVESYGQGFGFEIENKNSFDRLFGENNYEVNNYDVRKCV